MATGRRNCQKKIGRGQTIRPGYHWRERGNFDEFGDRYTMCEIGDLGDRLLLTRFWIYATLRADHLRMSGKPSADALGKTTKL
jgi:hypothetical protein